MDRPDRLEKDELRCIDPFRLNSRLGRPSMEAAIDPLLEFEVLLECDLLETESLRCGGRGGGGDGVGFSARTVGNVTPLTVVSAALLW